MDVVRERVGVFGRVVGLVSPHTLTYAFIVGITIFIYPN